MKVDTFGGPVHVEWDPDAAVTPLGHLAFFAEYLKVSGRFDALVADCPLHYTSPNAPSKRDVLGTVLLSVLAGQSRYAHITALRGDGVNPALLGMGKVASEDSVRRGVERIGAEEGTSWLQGHLDDTVRPLLSEPWVLDCDTTIKPLYGHQEGAVVSYNPKKPGRPSHACHAFLMAGTRLVLDVDVAPATVIARTGRRRPCGLCWTVSAAIAGRAWCGATRTGAARATWHRARRRVWTICSSCA